MAEMRIKGTLDTRNYERGIKKMQGENKKFGNEMGGLKSKIAKTFAAAVILRFVQQAGRAVLRWATDVSIAARNLGIMTGEMIALNRVAMGFSLTTQDASRIMSRLATEIHKAAKEGGTAAEKFAAIGLSVDDLIRLDPVEQLRAVARAAMESGMPLENLAEILGERLGPKAVAMLKDLADNGLGEVSREAGRLADQAEMMATRWTQAKDRMKQGVLELISAIDNLYSKYSAFVSTLFRTRDFSLAVNAANMVDIEHEKTLDRMSEERDAHQRQRQEELAKLVEKRLRDEADAQRAIEEERARRITENIEKIRGSVKMEVDTDSMRRMGGFAGQAVSEQLRYARQQSEIMRRLEDYQRSLPAIERNTRDGGGLV